DRKPETGRHDPDDSETRVVENDRAPDGVRVTRELPPPAFPTQDRRSPLVAASGLVFLGQEGAPQRRRRAEQREQISRDDRSAQPHGLAVPREREVGVVVSPESL